MEYFEDTEAQLQKTSKINLIDLAGSERASKVLDGQVITDSDAANSRLKVCMISFYLLKNLSSIFLKEISILKSSLKNKKVPFYFLLPMYPLGRSY